MPKNRGKTPKRKVFIKNNFIGKSHYLKAFGEIKQFKTQSFLAPLKNAEPLPGYTRERSCVFSRDYKLHLY